MRGRRPSLVSTIYLFIPKEYPFYKKIQYYLNSYKIACKIRNLIILHANLLFYNHTRSGDKLYIKNQQDALSETIRLDLIIIMNKYQTSHRNRCNKYIYLKLSYWNRNKFHVKYVIVIKKKHRICV